MGYYVAMPYKDSDAQRAYQNEWTKRQRTTWLRQNGPCAVCGSWEDLQVDHVEPGEKVSHRIWSWSASRRDVELEKCQALCLPCHKVKTCADQAPPPHGTNVRYTNRYWKCRCSECREAHRIANAKYR
jgi:5-methylcytosine-specific restriction endonuclease McrA